MIENSTHQGVFHVWDNPGYDREEVGRYFERYGFAGLSGKFPNYKRCENLLMASQKLLMAQAVYPNIDSLIITSQTGIPQDNETSYSGTIYTADSSIEAIRSGNTNPYVVGWNITSDDANGVWGSFVLVDSGDSMINRALAGITKVSGQGKIVVFTGTVVN